MRRERTKSWPCVVVPATPWRDEEEHVRHATHWRAQRNADLTAGLGFYYHVHEVTVPTLYGRLRRLLGVS